ncbi:hypothetical protein Pelo_17685 [Pelomyxa schiedti]|nr:hypothetical protein Pelo_17685 [Pelomyxa schiedti]
MMMAPRDSGHAAALSTPRLVLQPQHIHTAHFTPLRVVPGVPQPQLAGAGHPSHVGHVAVGVGPPAGAGPVHLHAADYSAGGDAEEQRGHAGAVHHAAALAGAAGADGDHEAALGGGHAEVPQDAEKGGREDTRGGAAGAAPRVRRRGQGEELVAGTQGDCDDWQ